jgi:hypothetical protein
MAKRDESQDFTLPGCDGHRGLGVAGGRREMSGRFFCPSRMSCHWYSFCISTRQSNKRSVSCKRNSRNLQRELEAAGFGRSASSAYPLLFFFYLHAVLH